MMLPPQQTYHEERSGNGTGCSTITTVNLVPFLHLALRKGLLLIASVSIYIVRFARLKHKRDLPEIEALNITAGPPSLKSAGETHVLYTAAVCTCPFFRCPM